jgi:hypothetical protein
MRGKEGSKQGHSLVRRTVSRSSQLATAERNNGKKKK